MNDLYLRGVCLKGIYLVGESMTSGAFGDVYWGKDFKNTRLVAIKVEKKIAHENGFLEKESETLLELSTNISAEPILRHYAYGEAPHFRYLIMELGGMNLRELKKDTEYDQFRIDTSLWIAKKMIEALKLLHDLGWVHRDVKPANFCIGRGWQGNRRLYIVDFGISRKFKQLDGQPMKPRKRCSFRGTLRYSSIRTQQNEEAGPSDDLWSVWYVAVENMTGQLPWRRQVAPKDVLAIKQQFVADQYVQNRTRNPIFRRIQPPVSMLSLLQRLAPSNYFTVFNYSTITSEIDDDLRKLNFGDATKLEWE
uniref:Protein kinase domain-containing protein n=1 Tax=Acrobeloides nanus TaxID=290746 RepID=A0A914CPJ5_9BILA